MVVMGGYSCWMWEEVIEQLEEELGELVSSTEYCN